MESAASSAHRAACGRRAVGSPTDNDDEATADVSVMEARASEPRAVGVAVRTTGRRTRITSMGGACSGAFCAARQVEALRTTPSANVAETAQTRCPATVAITFAPQPRCALAEGRRRPCSARGTASDPAGCMDACCAATLRANATADARDAAAHRDANDEGSTAARRPTSAAASGDAASLREDGLLRLRGGQHALGGVHEDDSADAADVNSRLSQCRRLERIADSGQPTRQVAATRGRGARWAPATARAPRTLQAVQADSKGEAVGDAGGCRAADGADGRQWGTVSTCAARRGQLSGLQVSAQVVCGVHRLRVRAQTSFRNSGASRTFANKDASSPTQRTAASVHESAATVAHSTETVGNPVT